MNRFAVVDTETTGFGKTDRILEIGIVLVDGSEIVQEWETLINPERDISNSEIHGITSELVSLAPIFEEVADEIGAMLNERIFVAHNVAFDLKILGAEFKRIRRGIEFGVPYCTLQATKMKLEKACEEFNILKSGSHRALTDARATAILLSKVYKDNEINSSVDFKRSNEESQFLRTLSRSAIDENHSGTQNILRRIGQKHEMYGAQGPLLSYLDALSSALSDFVLTKDESIELARWAAELGLSKNDVDEANEIFIKEIVEVAGRDNYISPKELELISKVSAALGVVVDLDMNLDAQTIETQFRPGLQVCFTGTARDSNGVELTREFLESTAISRGLVPVSSVTKKSCDLLIAADKSSMSGKTKKARDFGINVISVSEFLDRI
jgi:DNA polymerase III subunit epsilon